MATVDSDASYTSSPAPAWSELSDVANRVDDDDDTNHYTHGDADDVYGGDWTVISPTLNDESTSNDDQYTIVMRLDIGDDVGSITSSGTNNQATPRWL